MDNFPGPSEAADLIQQYSDEFESLVVRVPPEDASRRGVIGGDWSVSDLVGHIETWEEAALRTIEAWPGLPENPDWEGIDAFNAETVEQKRSRSWAEAWESYQATHSRLLDAVRSTSENDWNAVNEGEEDMRTLGQRVASNLGAPRMPFGHVAAHIEDLREAVGGLAAR